MGKIGHGGDALARDGGASANISLWAVQSRHWSSSIERCRDLAQSLIERNHSTLKGVQVKSIATGWGGGAGGAGHWLSPSASSAGRAQAVSMGSTAFPPQEGEVRPAVLCSDQDKAGSNASRGWMWQAAVGRGQGSHGSLRSCFSVSIKQGWMCPGWHSQPREPAASTLDHKPPLQN